MTMLSLLQGEKNSIFWIRKVSVCAYVVEKLISDLLLSIEAVFMQCALSCLPALP